MKLKELCEARFDLKTGQGVRNADKLSHTLEKAEDIASAIKAHAGDMLQAYELAGGKVLYRGMGSGSRYNIVAEPIAQLATIRSDRMAVEMASWRHEVLDKAFKQLGYDATRKNGIFCTSMLDVARDWGSNTFVIFLKDGWSGTVFDAAKGTYAFNELSQFGCKGCPEADNMAAAIKIIKELEPRRIATPEDLAGIITEKYKDIILTGHSYIALETEEALTEEVGKFLGLKGLR